MKPQPASNPGAAGRESLLQEFAVPAPEAWRHAAEKALKGVPFEKLHTRTREGIELQPIYRLEDIMQLRLCGLPGSGTHRRGSRASGHLGAPWLISQDVPGATPTAFNTAALAALQRGQTELNLVFDDAASAGRDPDDALANEVGVGGVSIATLADLDHALAGIDPRAIALCVHPGTAMLAAGALLLALARKRSLPFGALHVCIACDPLGLLAARGRVPASLDLAFQEMASLTEFALGDAPSLHTIAVKTHVWHDAGATAVQELALAVATGVEYLRELDRRGISAVRAARLMRFELSAGANFFMEVAKFRALRQLWSHAAGSLGVKSEDRRIHLHVRTSALTKTACDVHTNILRATTEALSAVVGGCDGLHVGAFDAAHGAPGELARRIAQNTHAILAEECDLTRVIDPAGGSYYVEWLTDQVARRAWSLFQEIEKSGGMTQALGAGLPQNWVAESARAQADAVARRRTVVIGANQYPNPADTFAPEPAAHDVHRTRTREMAAFRRTAAAEANPLLLERMAILLETRAGSVVASAAMSGALHGATLGGICRALRHYDKEPAQVRAVAAQRLGEPFEKLRLASANWTKAHGAPPVLFQANLGPLAAYRVRAEWTTAFFAVGGFKVVHDQEFAEPAAAAEAALKSGARAVVITADDATYPNVVAPLAQLLKSRDPAIAVVVAGAPGENADAWRAAGVDAFVHRACNALELLTDLLTRAGVLS